MNIPDMLPAGAPKPVFDRLLQDVHAVGKDVLSVHAGEVDRLPHVVRIAGLPIHAPPATGSHETPAMNKVTMTARSTPALNDRDA